MEQLFNSTKHTYDYLIVGAGIIGMTIAYELKSQNKNLKIVIIDKEKNVAEHASGRNSGIIHSGFYYSKNSLKAKFCVEGNKLIKEFCYQNGISVNPTQKVVIAKNEEDLKGIYELHKRAKNNGVETKIISELEVLDIDPNIRTYKKALFSPNTSSVNPKEVCYKLRDILLNKGVDFCFKTEFKDCKMKFNYLINCAGAYSDKIAQRFSLAKNYTMLPFKGQYLKYMSNKKDVKVNIYPVPNLKNPFLGVHFSKTNDGSIKIGPTAIPVFWRENYNKLDNFQLKEMIEIIYYQLKLFVLNSFNFRQLALEEMKNYVNYFFIKKAKTMVKNIDNNFKKMPSGIRAQLLDTQNNKLVQDFIVEHSKESTHILNAVSPAFTSSFAFAKYIVKEIEKNQYQSNEIYKSYNN